MVNAALIQSRIYRGSGRAAAVLGESYSFYRYSAPGSPGVLLGEDGSRTLLEDGSGAIGLETPPVPSYLLSEDGQRNLDEDGTPILSEAPTPTGALLTEDGQRSLGEDGQPLVAEATPGAGGPYASPTTGNSYGSLNVSLNAQDMRYRKPNGYGKPLCYAIFDATAAQVGDYLVGPQGTFFVAARQLLLPVLVVECNATVSLLNPQQQTSVGALPYGGTTIDNQTPVLTAWPASVLQGTKGEKTEATLPGDTRAPWWTILLPRAAGVDIEFGDILTDDRSRRFIVSSPELTDLGWRITAMQAVS